VSPYQGMIGRFYLIGLVAGAYLIAGPIMRLGSKRPTHADVYDKEPRSAD
jgi:hypothetical protein